MDKRAQDLIEMGDKLFTERQSLDQFWQEVALNFHVEMADFTDKRDRGEDFAEHLTASYPLIARRTLGDSFAAMLRPVSLDSVSSGVWFAMKTKSDAVNEDMESQRWMEDRTKLMRRAMYDRVANFARSTKEADHMFASFGQAPLTLDLNLKDNALLYRAWHLRDVVWSEDITGQIARIHRVWRPYAVELVKMFGDRAGPKAKEMANDPARKFDRIECRHIIVPGDEYEIKRGRKWASVYIDKDNEHIIEETPKDRHGYIIPRWVTVPGSQYASSPAVTAALPDARLLQAMTLTLLEAGEKHADPPMVATEEAVRSDINLFAGGVTYIDPEYDERSGEAIRPLYNHRTGEGLSYAINMREDIKQTIARAFFLDSLSLPPADVKDMTAFEVSQRISEWIRRAMPIFEPLEFEYNAVLCEETFDLLLRHGAFGPSQDIPIPLRRELERGFEWRFESPLHESSERRKGQKFLEAKAALMEAAQLDQAAMGALKATDALRDVLDGIGVPADWRASEQEIAATREKMAQEAAAQQALALMGNAGEGARNLGAAAKDFAQVGNVTG